MTRREPFTVCLATNNAHKVEELRAIFARLIPHVRALSLAEAGGPFPEPVEDASTFAGNAVKKARHYARLTGMAVIADDSGLCVDCLHGNPGLLSARYADTNDERIARVLREVEEAELDAEATGKPFSRSAHFACAMAFCADADVEPVVVEGRADGLIRPEPLGEGGFGYDPIFFLPEFGLTMAQLAPEKKNALSHRARASQAMAKRLAELPLGA